MAEQESRHPASVPELLTRELSERVPILVKSEGDIRVSKVRAHRDCPETPVMILRRPAEDRVEWNGKQDRTADYRCLAADYRGRSRALLNSAPPDLASLPVRGVLGRRPELCLDSVVAVGRRHVEQAREGAGRHNGIAIDVRDPFGPARSGAELAGGAKARTQVADDVGPGGESDFWRPVRGSSIDDEDALRSGGFERDDAGADRRSSIPRTYDGCDRQIRLARNLRISDRNSDADMLMVD